MNLNELFAIVGAFSLILATQVQLLKAHTPGLSGGRVILLSLLLGALEGALLAWVGVSGLNALTSVQTPISGAVIGLLAGVTASGGKDLLTGIGANYAKAQARYNPADCDPPAASADEWVEVPPEQLLD